MGVEDVLMAPRSPWQNPSVERLIGSSRRACVDHLVILNERPLMHVLARYFAYDHQWRPQLSLAMDYPAPCRVPLPHRGEVIAVPEVGGLHHHDERRTACIGGFSTHCFPDVMGIRDAQGGLG
jgi:hypothetical protein